jgi:uncharacterized delta-60 repeat protein/uncharacterized repeat protein (TIGR01451 family)
MTFKNLNKRSFIQRGMIGLLIVGLLALIPVFLALAAPGDLDPTFGTNGQVVEDLGGNDWATGVVIQTDGDIVVSGQGGSNADFVLARYNSDGSLDTGFGVSGGVTFTDFGGSDRANAMVRQTDDKFILVGGSGNSNFALARYNSDGSPDTSFDADGQTTTGFGGSAYDVGLQTDGKIVVVGMANGDFAVARYNSDGSPDTGFGASGGVTFTDLGGDYDLAAAVVVLSDDRILVAGHAGSMGAGDMALVRYDSNGLLDTTFGSGGILTLDFSGGNDWALDLVLQDDDKILLGGYATAATTDFALARYNSDGSLDTGFGTDGKVVTDFNTSSDNAAPVVLQTDGKIVVAGASEGDFALARYNSDGSLDDTFVTDGSGTVTTDFGGANDTIRSMALQDDGMIVAVGFAGSISSGDFALARYLGGAGTPPTTVTIDKQASATTLPVAGGPLTYTLSFSLGSAGGTAVITDVIPTYLTGYTYTVSSGVALTETGSADYVWQASVPGGGGVITITGVITTPSGTFLVDTPITNTAVISALGVSVQDEVVVTVITPKPDLAVSKTVDTGGQTEVELGSVVTYTITVQNSGTGSATDVILTDIIPAGLSVVTPPGTGSFVAPELTWGPEDVAAGETITITFSAVVTTSGTFAGQPIINTVEYNSGNAGSGSDSASFNIAQGRTYIYLPIVTNNYTITAKIQP